MKITSKFNLLVISLLLLALVGLVGYQTHQQKQQSLWVARELEAHQDYLLNLVSHEQDTLSREVWELTLIPGITNHFISETGSIDSRLQGGLDDVWITDTQGNVQSYYRKNFQSPPITLPVSSNEIASLFKKTYSTPLFIKTTQGVLLLTGSPVRQSGTQSTGYVVAGQRWDGNFEKKISQQRGTPIQVILYPTTVKQEKSDPKRGLYYSSTFLYTQSKQPIAYLQAKIHSPFLEQNYRFMWQLKVINLVIGVVLLSLLAMAITYWINKPLKKLSLSLQTHDINYLKSLLPKQDEFGNLARTIKDFFQQQEALLQSENRMRLLLEGAIEAVLLEREDGTIMDCNNRALWMYGYTRSEMLQLNGIKDLRVEDAIHQITSHTDSRFPDSQLIEGWNRRKDGSLFPVEVSIVQIILEDRKVFMVYVRDITQRKEAEKQSKALYELALKLTEVTDIHQAVSSSLDTALSLTGLSFGSIYLMNPATHYFELQDSRNMTPDMLEVMQQVTPDTPWCRDIMGGKVVYGQDYLPESFIGDSSELITDTAFIPIKSANQVIGSLNVASRPNEILTPEECRVLESVANQFGSALVRIQFEAELRETVQMLNALVESSPAAIILLDNNGKVRLWNAAAEEIFGWTSEEVLGKVLPNIPESKEQESYEVQQSISKGVRIRDMELRRMCKDGRIIDVSLNGAPLYGPEGQLIGLMGIMLDITEKKQALEKLKTAAFFDHLTGLPNRSRFMERLNHLTARSERHPDFNFAVLYMDLDRFKDINDSMGHPTGDRVLRDVGQRINQSLRLTDMLARIGGDEFTLLMEDATTPADVIPMANRILDVLSEPIRIQGRDLVVNTSIGIAFSRRDDGSCKTPEEILRDADMAMYRAKDTSKGTYALFDQRMFESMRSQFELEADLRTALRENQLYLRFQPVMDIERNNLYSIETLVYWDHPERGPITPGVFIPVAELTGLIAPLTEWVLLEACRQIAQWKMEFHEMENVGVSVNVSPKLFDINRITGPVREALLETDLNPESVFLEVTESAVLKTPNQAREIFRELKAMGCRIHLDDFGTGYTSLHYLLNYPIDLIKIDRSYILHMEEDPRHRRMVMALLSMARSLRLDVIAEGVETPSQQEFLRQNHCRYIQGNLYSPPLRSLEMEAFLSRLYRDQVYE